MSDDTSSSIHRTISNDLLTVDTSSSYKLQHDTEHMHATKNEPIDTMSDEIQVPDTSTSNNTAVDIGCKTVNFSKGTDVEGTDV